MENKIQLFATVVIGGQNIYVQIINKDNLEIVENTSHDINLGEDVFSEKIIQSQTVNEVKIALDKVKDLIDEYQVKDYTCYATHSFYEANNSEYVREQLQKHIGSEIQWINQSQEALYRNQATHTYMKDFPEIIKEDTILIDISSGNVELIAYQKGDITFSRNLKLGPLRVYEVMRDIKISVDNYVEVLQDYVASQLIDFIRLVPIKSAKNVVVLGSSITIFDRIVDNITKTLKLDNQSFKRLYNEVKHSTDQYLMDRYSIDEDSVHQVLPVMILIKQILNFAKSKTLWISGLKIIDGISINQAQKLINPKSDWGQHQLSVKSAYNLAKQYQVEEKHQSFVVNTSLKLFDDLKDLHGLGVHERSLLEIAAIVDDVGNFINSNDHYAHSDYIIQNSEILGLSNVDLTMVAAVSRYHSYNTPSAQLKRYDELNMRHRMNIVKLATILRLADALDASRQQKIKKITASLKDDTKLIVKATANDDLELENWLFRQKGQFFESVFGIKPKLKGRITL